MHNSNSQNKIFSKTTKQTGFTIVELLIVIVVIAILAAISIVAYRGIQDRAKSASLASEISQVHKALQLASADSGAPTVSTPVAYLKGSGTQSLMQPIVNSQELSMYAVFDTANSPSTTNWNAIAQLLPNTSGNQITLRTGSSGDASARGFYETSATLNRDVTQQNVLNTNARHIGWITARSGMLYSGYDSGSASASLANHSGWSFDSVRLNNHNTGFSPVVVLIFSEYHDETARSQVFRWLTEEYKIAT